VATTPNTRRPRRSRRDEAAAFAAGLATCWVFGACTTFEPPPPAPPPACPEQTAKAEEATKVYSRAGMDRTKQLELEVERLHADLEQAEESMVAIESGLRGIQGRAGAVSALAESRIAVERAAQNAPWRRERIEEARRKLDEAERQLQADHTGSAVFFASRARRIAAAMDAEAERVANAPGTRFIDGQRVNLRAGPSTDTGILGVLVDATPVVYERTDGEWQLVRTASGQVGWVHRSLLRNSWSPPATTTQSLPASLAR
jgi:SH3-like domain-containing protein